MRGFARDVSAVSDTVGELNINDVLLTGAGACGGTRLVEGLSAHAQQEHDHVQKLSADLNGLASTIMDAIDSAQRMDGAPLPTSSTES